MSHGGMQTRNTRIGHIWDIHNKLTQPNSIKENQICKEPAFNLKIKTHLLPVDLLWWWRLLFDNHRLHVCHSLLFISVLKQQVRCRPVDTAACQYPVTIEETVPAAKPANAWQVINWTAKKFFDIYLLLKAANC